MRKANPDSMHEVWVTRAIPPDRRTKSPPPLEELRATWQVLPQNAMFEAKVWIDGSAFNPEDELLCRA
eukprot:4418567-Karenia_brevis.AAC.1